MPRQQLDGRGVVRVAGSEARGFLDRLVTCAMDPVAPGRPGFGALLTPQGKILVDFIVHGADGEPDAFLIDVAADRVADLVRRLTLYRLRARIEIADRSDIAAVTAGWDGEPMPSGPGVSAGPDPRLGALGWRSVGTREQDRGSTGYEDHRIGCAIPEGGRDFPWGDAFPHEALMDQLGGVDFRKGCYVGQEVVSRMQHRGTARTRIVPVVLVSGPAPGPGAAILAGERAIGTAGTMSGARGLVTLRLDRVAEAGEAGQALATEGGATTLRLGDKPDWVRFPWPGEVVPA